MRERVLRLCLNLLGISLLVLMLAIVIQVLCSALDINPIATFLDDKPVLGRAITLNSLLDFQWHLLVLVGILPAGMVWLIDRHVRVDFFYRGFTQRRKRAIDFVGNCLFAAPFFALVLPASIKFLQRAWSSDEGSPNDGLNDLWLIKSVLPVGLGLFALCVLVETIRLVRARL